MIMLGFGFGLRLDRELSAGINPESKIYNPKSLSAADGGLGKRAENRELFAAALQRGQGLFHFRILDVAFEINEKHIFRVFELGGKRFDPRQIEFGLAEDIEGANEASRLMRNPKHQCRLVVAAAIRLLMADHREARFIVRIVFDVGEQEA